MTNLTVPLHDDLGLSAAVNEAVLLLAEKSRIHSTSFMSFGKVNSPVLYGLQRLAIDVGLHLDFTELVKEMYDFGSLKQVIKSSWLRTLPRDTVTQVIERQFDLFEEKIGAMPTFIDGHQHLHQFPIIRDTLLEIIQIRYGKMLPVRSTKPAQSELKAKIIYNLGGRSFDKMCQNQNTPTNKGFAGISDVSTTEATLRKMWSQWLQNTSHNGGLIMCHPAIPDSSWSDAIKPAREIEFSWLLSDEFGDMVNSINHTREHWGELS